MIPLSRGLATLKCKGFNEFMIGYFNPAKRRFFARPEWLIRPALTAIEDIAGLIVHPYKQVAPRPDVVKERMNL